MDLLVVTSCTGKKTVDPAGQLSRDDFEEPPTLAAAESRLREHMRPAGQMYTGDQHVRVMRAIGRLRGAFGEHAVTLAILSAGYGVVTENQPIAPYDVTFNTMSPREARAWATSRGAGPAVASLIRRHEATVLCLGDRYLDALGSMPTARERRVMFFAKEGIRRKIEATGGIFFPAGTAQTSMYGAGNVALKGQLLDLLARGLVANKARWQEILRDPTNRAVSLTIEEGLRASSR